MKVLLPFILLFFVRCVPSFYPLNTKIESLNIKLEFGEKVKENDRVFLRRKLRHFIEDYNSAKHSFWIDTLNNEHFINIKVERVRIPGVFAKFICIGANVAYSNIVLNPLLIYFPLFFTNNTSICYYSLCPKLKNPLKDKEIKIFLQSRSKFFKNRKNERASHLFDFDNQMNDLLKLVERDYCETNKLKMIIK